MPKLFLSMPAHTGWSLRSHEILLHVHVFYYNYKKRNSQSLDMVGNNLSTIYLNGIIHLPYFGTSHYHF